jgi:hypothetical protein
MEISCIAKPVKATLVVSLHTSSVKLVIGNGCCCRDVLKYETVGTHGDETTMSVRGFPWGFGWYGQGIRAAQMDCMHVDYQAVMGDIQATLSPISK